MPLLIAILGVLFILLFLIVWLSFVFRFICYYLSDYLHYKHYGEVLFDPETTRDFLLLTAHLDIEYEQIKAGKKAEDYGLYRISFMMYYYTTTVMRYTILPFVIVAVLFFALMFFFDESFM